MHSLPDRIIFQIKQLRLGVVLGFILLAISLTVYKAILVPAQTTLLHIDAEIQLARNHKATLNISPTQNTNNFYTKLPESTQVNTILESMFDHAYEQNLAIDTVNYQLKKESNVRFDSYIIDLPTNGKYPDIMKFTYDMLREHPSLALNTIHLSRDVITSNDIDAEMQFVLYLKK